MLKLNQAGTSRITRKQYLVAFLIYLGLSVIGYTLLEPIPVVGFLMCVGALIFWYVAMIERAHDCGNSWWYLLIPFYNLWLFFAPGEPGDNLYGPDPRVPTSVGLGG